MTATLPPPAALPAQEPIQVPARPERAGGVELLGPVNGSGYRDGTGLIRRSDGQMIQLGPLMYAVLASADGRCDTEELARVSSTELGRTLTADQVRQLCTKLARQGLLVGTEQAAPPRANPLLALRWKFLVTNPTITRRITAPFAFLFSGWVMWPMLAAFAAICWYVLFDRGLAAATAEAFRSPGLLLVIFALGVLSAGIHEFGHAAACRRGGATPGGMGAGLYLVWPAFYTDVTDAYRLDRRSRLRVDLGGLYFNVLVAVVTMAVWLAVRNDTLLLLVGLQLLQMVKQLSPVIRADGYHILADVTGVPDLYAHLGPTLRRLLPGGRKEPSVLTRRARALVTVWVLVVVPVLLSLMVGAVLLLPRLATSAWDSGRQIVDAIPHESITGDLAAALRLLALFLPVIGSSYIAVRLARMAVRRGNTWSRGRPARRLTAIIAAAATVAALAWAWWPSGQYQPVRASERGTIGSLVHLIGAPRSVQAQPLPAQAAALSTLPPGRHLAFAMIPRGGPTSAHPAFLVVPGQGGDHPVGVVTGGAAGSPASTGIDFPFRLPAAPGPGDTQALAVNTTDGGVVYDIDYAIITVQDGAPVTNTNSAFALADCTGCTTVAVSFQVVLVIGQSDRISPIDAAGALNADCIACMTTAVADQLVLTLSAEPSADLMKRLTTQLKKLNAIQLLGAGADPTAIAAEVAAVQKQIVDDLSQSGLLVTPTPSIASSAAPSPVVNESGSPSADSSSPAASPSITPSASATDSASASASASPSASTTSPAPSAASASPTGSP